GQVDGCVERVALNVDEGDGSDNVDFAAADEPVVEDGDVVPNEIVERPPISDVVGEQQPPDVVGVSVDYDGGGHEPVPEPVADNLDGVHIPLEGDGGEE